MCLCALPSALQCHEFSSSTLNEFCLYFVYFDMPLVPFICFFNTFPKFPEDWVQMGTQEVLFFTPLPPPKEEVLTGSPSKAEAVLQSLFNSYFLVIIVSESVAAILVCGPVVILCKLCIQDSCCVFSCCILHPLIVSCMLSAGYNKKIKKLL